MIKRTVVFALTSLPFFALAQFAKTDTLQEVMINENRLQSPFNKQARQFRLITQEEIAQMHVKSLNEVLSYVLGLDLRQRGPFGTQADVSMDGGSFEQTLVLLNGMKISDVQTAHHSLNIPVPLLAIERIEVLKGPAARIYGVNALTGAINIVTKKSFDTFALVNLQSGSAFSKKEANDGSGVYAGAGLQGLINQGSSTFRQLLTFGLNKSSGQRYNSTTKDEKIFYQNSLQINPNNQIELMGGYLHNAFGASGYYAAPIDKEAYEIVSTALAAISSKHQLTKNWTVKPRFSSRYNWDDYRFYRNNLSKSRSQHRTALWAAELNTALHTTIGDFGWGIESRSENIQSTNIGHQQRYNHGMYLEYKNEILSDFLLNLGAYLNYNTQYGWQAYPGLDMAYAFTKHWRLNFNLGTSQRIPSFTDLYLKQAPANIGNANLKPEHAWQSEWSLQYQQAGLQWQIGYFYRNITDFIDWIRTSNSVPYQPQNFGENRVNGLYTAVKHQLKLSDHSRIAYDVAYQYLKNTQSAYSAGITSKYLIDNLRNQLIVGLYLKSHNWNLQINNRWLQRENKKAYNLTDVRVGYEKKQWGVYADVNNLFDTKYIEVAAVPLPRKWFTLGFNYRIDFNKSLQ